MCSIAKAELGFVSTFCLYHHDCNSIYFSIIIVIEYLTALTFSCSPCKWIARGGWTVMINSVSVDITLAITFADGLRVGIFLFSDPFSTCIHGMRNYPFHQTPKWGGNLSIALPQTDVVSGQV